uniref:Uncharacterized protein LOC100186430 n=1 Tax=Phallusia mammillata TaxID=59560 RepID=A0A6F9DJ66_9ASCI|nr:uncharacterized protein LOC100186430 [Phallusia mammillata]
MSAHQFSVHSSSPKTAVELISWSIYPVLGDQAIKVVGCLKESGHKKASGVITNRVNARCVSSKSGTTYNLVGPICDHNSLPSWLVKDFRRGFPTHWKVCVQTYLEWLESVQSDTDTEIEANDHDNELTIKHNLFKWAIHVRESQLYVEGFVLSENGVPQLYRTSAVDEAVNKRLLRTITGSFYTLKGPICLESTMQANVPSFVAHKFDNGFPENWKQWIPIMTRATEVESESFHGISDEENDTTSVWSHEMKHKKRTVVPQLEWDSFTSTNTDSTLNVSDLSTDVQIPDTVKSNRLVSKTAKNDIGIARLSVENKDMPYGDEFETPTNIKTKLTNNNTFSTVKKSKLVNKYDDLVKCTVLRSGKRLQPPDDHLSSVCDDVCTSGLQRQCEVDQLLSSPPKCFTKKHSSEPKCVKRLSTSIHTPDKNSKCNMACKVVLTRLPPKDQINTKATKIIEEKRLEATTQKEPVSDSKHCLRKRKEPTKKYSNEGKMDETNTTVAKKDSINTKKAKPKNKQISKLKANEAKTKQKPPKKKTKPNDTVSKPKESSSHSLDSQEKPSTNKPKKKRSKSVSLDESAPKRLAQNLETKRQNGTNKENETQVTKVTAKKGTLKHRRQVKQVLGALNVGPHTTDIFSDRTKSEVLNSNVGFSDINVGMFDAAVTPSTKFSYNFTTPSWFKTPVVGDTTDSLMHSKTPAHLSCEPFTQDTKSMDATDKIIVNVQKLKKKKNQKTKIHKTPNRHKKKLHVTQPFASLFNKSKDSIHSSDDEYFSDS